MSQTQLSRYDNSWYYPGASHFKRLLWYFVNAVFFQNPLNPSNGVKVFLLRLFGASLGKGIVIKPGVNIKYPWLLEVGDYTWIGEAVWIDNLTKISIGRNVCISQGAMLLTGNHNYRKSTFDLIISPITLQDGVWIGAKAIVCPGVICYSHSVLTVNSVATHDLEANEVYQGNPAEIVKKRIIQEE